MKQKAAELAKSLVVLLSKAVNFAWKRGINLPGESMEVLNHHSAPCPMERSSFSK